jgi:hypothetical protein
VVYASSKAKQSNCILFCYASNLQLINGMDGSYKGLVAELLDSNMFLFLELFCRFCGLQLN